MARDEATFFDSDESSSGSDLGGLGGEVNRVRPRRVRDYILGNTLGKGAYATVKEGLDTRTARVVAVKALERRALLRNPTGMANVKREIAIMKALAGHRNVIDYIDVIDDPSMRKLYIVLEMANGYSLQHLIDKAPDNRIPQSQMKGLFCMLMTGLSFIHGKGVIHRDIKPANLLFNSKGELKISDFGVAEFLDRYNSMDAVQRTAGSPAFQAPEIANGDSTYSGMKVDVWAAGVTLYYSLVGKVPFHADTWVDLYKVISLGEFTIPDFLDPDAVDLIQGMLEIDSDKRLSVREILHHPWLQNRPSHAEPDWIEIDVREPQVFRMARDLLEESWERGLSTQATIPSPRGNRCGFM